MIGTASNSYRVEATPLVGRGLATLALFPVAESSAVPVALPVKQVTAGSDISGSARSRSNWIGLQTSKIRALSPNWDGYGADPIAPATIEKIEGLLKYLVPSRARPGTLVPAADGSVQAEWHTRAVSFGLLVEEGGLTSCWIRLTGSDQEVERHGFDAQELFKAAAQAYLG
jgi:hypothetical protein